MGIDIYARWPGQTAQERDAQITGFDVTAGAVGYLREAYHGEPYATQYLVREAFAAPTGEARIPAAELRERLPGAIALALERERTVYDNAGVTRDHPAIQSFVQFVELCERKERETGTPVTIVASY
ncbi:MAG: hypothetical protein FJ087_22590 [Deltaproteobacteria bacterium]|nr:hypothetical protein [Deltaproteobacteria bacterium]